MEMIPVRHNTIIRLAGSVSFGLALLIGLGLSAGKQGNAQAVASRFRKMTAKSARTRSA
jgi:hypothetical protein